MTGDVKAPLAGRSQLADRQGRVVDHGGGAPWQSASFDAETNTIIVGAGNPGPWNTWAHPPRVATRTTTTASPSGQVGVDPSSGEVKWFYQHTLTTPGTSPAATNWWLFDYKGAGRQDRSVPPTPATQRPSSMVDPQQRQVAERLPLRRQHHLGQPHRPEDRPPPGGARGQRPPLPETGAEYGARRAHRRSSAARTGTRWPTAGEPACSTCRPTTGRKTTDRGQLYEGQRLPGYGLPDQAYVRRLLPAACAPWTRWPGKVVWKHGEHLPL